MSKQKGNRNWTEKEIEILEENLGFKPPSEIVKINLMIAEPEKERDEIKPNLVSLIENNGDTIKSNFKSIFFENRVVPSHHNHNLPLKQECCCRAFFTRTNIKNSVIALSSAIHNWFAFIIKLWYTFNDFLAFTHFPSIFQVIYSFGN